jgi:hypothetical protein
LVFETAAVNEVTVLDSLAALVLSDRSWPAAAEVDVAADPKQVAATSVTAVTVRSLRAETSRVWRFMAGPFPGWSSSSVPEWLPISGWS